MRRVFFPAGSGNKASQRVSFPIFDDAIDEEAEGFIIVLYRDDNLTSIDIDFTPNRRTTLGRINDNDRKQYCHNYPCAVCARVMRLCPSICVCVCIYVCRQKTRLFTSHRSKFATKTHFAACLLNL